MNDYWIPITYEEDTAEKLKAAVVACHKVHTFTLKTLNQHFIAYTENLLLGDFRRELAEFLRKNKETLAAQHYTLARAAEKTFPYFTENKKLNGDGKFITVKPIPIKKYTDIQIETRQIWQKYLALNSLITTTYGTVYLDKEQWQDIVADQGATRGLSFDAIPFLWHSVTLHIEASKSRLRFNLHQPYSKLGKKAVRKMKQHV